MFILSFEDSLRLVINIFPRVFIYLVFRSKLRFHIQRRRTMESLKTLAARSVAARVTSEESLTKLELPRSLIRDLVVAHEDPWKTRHERPLSYDGLPWLTHKNNHVIDVITLTNVNKFFFPDLPLDKIREVLQDNFNIAILMSHEGVPFIYLKDVMAVLPKMKVILGKPSKKKEEKKM